jgi:plastocyanin
VTRLVAVLAVVLFAVSLAVGTRGTHAQNTKLVATVGPGFTIVLRDASGARVTRLDPGTYEIEVQDLSNEHNFRLMGPGVNRATEVEDTGTVTWTVTLQDGTYRYWCDPHVGMMNGTFTVGTGGGGGGGGGDDGGGGGGSQPPSGVVTPSTRLQLTSGPGFAISLRTTAGRRVTRMRTGTYTVVVRDRSRIHNARLRGPGYNRATTVRFVGTQRWRVRLARPGTLRFLCDPHAAQMKGSARIVR